MSDSSATSHIYGDIMDSEQETEVHFNQSESRNIRPSRNFQEFSFAPHDGNPVSRPDDISPSIPWSLSCTTGDNITDTAMEQIINDYQATEWNFEFNQENEPISNVIGRSADMTDEIQTHLEETNYYQETEQPFTAHNGRFPNSNLTEGFLSAQWSVGSTPAHAEIETNFGEIGNVHRMEGLSESHNANLTVGPPAILQQMASASTYNQSLIQNETKLISATEKTPLNRMQKDIKPFCSKSIQQNLTFKFSSLDHSFEPQSEYPRDVSSVFHSEQHRLNSSLRLLLPEGGNINCTEKDSSDSQRVGFEESTDDNLTSVTFGNLCASAGPSSARDLIEQCEPMGLDAHRSSQDYRYVCPFPFCGRTIRYRNGFHSHLLTHTGEKPYICKICGKAFNQDSKCKSHIKNVHNKQ